MVRCTGSGSGRVQTCEIRMSKLIYLNKHASGAWIVTRLWHCSFWGLAKARARGRALAALPPDDTDAGKPAAAVRPLAAPPLVALGPREGSGARSRVGKGWGFGVFTSSLRGASRRSNPSFDVLYASHGLPRRPFGRPRNDELRFTPQLWFSSAGDGRALP